MWWTEMKVATIRAQTPAWDLSYLEHQNNQEDQGYTTVACFMLWSFKSIQNCLGDFLHNHKLAVRQPPPLVEANM